MTTNLTLTASDFMPILDAVATRYRNRDAYGGQSHRPSTKAVVYALLQAEKLTRQQHLTYPLEALLGDWRLCFTAPRKPQLKGDTALGNGFYVPQIAPAQISFTQKSTSEDAPQIEINNSIQLGSLILKFIGAARYLNPKNLLAFNFNQMQLAVFNRRIFNSNLRSTHLAEQSIAKTPFFAFFLVTENFIAARGRGGGIALWVKIS